MTREEYKKKYLKRLPPHKGRKSTLTIPWETKAVMTQLCSAADSRQITVSNLIENIFSDHIDANSGTIDELYQKDIPIS